MGVERTSPQPDDAERRLQIEKRETESRTLESVMWKIIDKEHRYDVEWERASLLFSKIINVFGSDFAFNFSNVLENNRVKGLEDFQRAVEAAREQTYKEGDGMENPGVREYSAPEALTPMRLYLGGWRIDPEGRTWFYQSHSGNTFVLFHRGNIDLMVGLFMNQWSSILNSHYTNNPHPLDRIISLEPDAIVGEIPKKKWNGSPEADSGVFIQE